jgi:UDP-GlcNAc:undecaprenyl-phosphate/decaprenyl-phosphate GlcNAc-1-phosphate transferase
VSLPSYLTAIVGVVVRLVLVAGAIALALTPVVRYLSNRWGLVDQPDHRKVHRTPMSRLGGVAIYFAVIGALAAQYLGELYLGWQGPFVEAATRANVLAILGGMTLVFVVGLVDDLRDLSPGVKFLGQLAAAAVVVFAGVRIEYIGNPAGGGLLALGTLSIPVTLIYIVAFTNIINLIDGLDGLAAGVSAIAGGTLLVLAIQGNRFDAAALAAVLIGACLGFLRYNFHPASIFMGDSGALFLGFTLATISLLGVMKTTAAIALAVPLLIVGVPIFDTASAIVRRWRHGRPIGEADRGHIHHRLLGRGFDQRQTVLIIYVWSILLSVVGYAVRYAPGIIKIAAMLGLFAVSAAMVYWLGLFEAVHHLDEDEVDIVDVETRSGADTV